MDRRELLKKSAAAGLVAAVPVLVAAERAIKKPTTLTTQAARITYTVSSADVTNGWAVIQVNWPSPFADTSYVAVGSQLYHSAGQNGAPNCTLDSGNRAKQAGSIEKVVDFNSAATLQTCTDGTMHPVCVGDKIDADFIGIGQV
jgi:hypothetical protein